MVDFWDPIFGTLMEKYEPIIQFFKSIGSEHESNMYLRLFKKGDPARFAVLHLDSQTFGAIPLFGVDLAYLSNLDLYPVVVHDSGEDDSRPVTKKSSALQHILQTNRDIVDAVAASGGRAQGFVKNVFELVPGPGKGLIQVEAKRIRAAVKADVIPVVAPLTQLPDGKTLLLDAREAAKALVLALQPKKYILIRPQGGLLDNEGNTISLVNVLPDMSFSPGIGALHPKAGALVKRLGNLLSMVNDPLVVEITSPQNLLRELFTIKGGGTLIKQGPEIGLAKSYAELDSGKLGGLLESCFGKKLVKGFFEKPVSFVLWEKTYKGAAILKKVDDFYYLDKFAVRKETQGDGIGADIWSALTARCPAFFWRSKPSNPINDWYYERCSGMQKTNEWFVYWINLDQNQRQRALEHALSEPESFQSIS